MLVSNTTPTSRLEPADRLEVRDDIDRGRERAPREVVSMAGVVAFSAAAGVLFVAAIIAYVVAWANKTTTMHLPALPWIFWLSTPAVLLSSLFLDYAGRSARAAHGVAAHRALLTATGMGFFFIGLQAPGMIMLGQMNLPFQAVSPTMYALMFVLIGLHLVHSVGGLVVLSAASLRSERHHYEVAEARQLKPITLYWHFVAVAWIAMFSMLLLVK
jgi:cytochrome c oxidase subunit 3